MGRGEPSSREVAKQRLQLVLVHDRANISPGLLATIKDEIISVISRHVEIDRSGVEVSFTQQGSESRLVADIPLSGYEGGRRGH
jgi:cell division topological specificity factor